MGNSIIFRMGADSTGMKKDLEAATEHASRQAKKMAASTNVRQKANEGLLESERRVESKMVGLASTLANSTSASDALAASVNALGDSINLSLGAGIAVGAIFTALSAARAEAAKLSQEIRELTAEKGSPDFRGLGDMEGQLTSLKAKLAALLKDRGGWKDAKEWLAARSLGDTTDFEARLKGEVADVMAAIEQAKKDIASKAGGQTNIMRKEAEGDTRGAALAKIRLEYDEKRGAAYKDQNTELAEQLKQQQAIAEAKVNGEFDRKKMEPVSALADEQAKAAMEAHRGDMANADALADKEADDIQEKKDLNIKAAQIIGDKIADGIQKQKDLAPKAADELAAADIKKGELFGPSALEIGIMPRLKNAAKELKNGAQTPRDAISGPSADLQEAINKSEAVTHLRTIATKIDNVGKVR